MSGDVFAIANTVEDEQTHNIGEIKVAIPPEALLLKHGIKPELNSMI